LAELSRAEKDVLLLGMIASHLNTSKLTQRSHQKNEDRKNTRMSGFFFETKPLCREGFLYLYDISKGTLDTLRSHYLENGVVPRTMNWCKLP
jgi:hypothetical protein